MGKVTIDTISRQTGYSRGTVSRALNDRGGISATTKQRVLEACRELNFVPNQAARALATGRSFTLAVFATRLDTNLTSSILHGAVRRARQLGYIVNLFQTGPVEEHELPPARMMTERLDGALVIGAAQLPPTALEAIEERPIVSTQLLDGPLHDWLGPDEVESGRLLARRLLRGVQQVLYVHRSSSDPLGRRRFGFEEICKERGASLRQLEVAEPLAATDPAWSELREALPALSAIACTDDPTAARVLCLSADPGRRFGRDLFIGGQGNEAFGGDLDPALTTTDLSGHEIGTRAVELLVQRLLGERCDAPDRILVAPRLVARESG